MMFLMLGDNAFHMFFNTWRLPRLLRLCNTTVWLIIPWQITGKKKKKENSHVKEKFSNRNPCVQKFHTRTKNPCQKKFPQPKPTWPKIVHNQKSCTQKGQCPTTTQKKKKTNAPPQISPQSKFFTCPHITTKSFFHNHAQKFLHDQDSQQIISYMSIMNKK